MHTYLESIGFKSIKTRQDMDRLISSTVLHFDEKNFFRDENGRMMGEFKKNYGPNIGLSVCGEFDDKGDYHPDYSYPYMKGRLVSSTDEISFERHAGNESYAGVCDDPRLGVTLIFYVNNGPALISKSGPIGGKTKTASVKLSALAREGTIILPALTNEWWEKESKRITNEHTKLVSAARFGDEEAIESLTMEDMDTYSMIQQRVQNEDILSIVDTTFMPNGVECDQYGVLGMIHRCEKVVNNYTNEKIWQLEVHVNGLIIDVSIHADRLYGEPAVNRRFKGNVWIQGEVIYI